MRNRRRVLYHPNHVKRLAAVVLRYAHEIEMLRDDIRHERDAIREERALLRAEMDAAWRELRRLQQIDIAQHAERDISMPLH
jgi:hypothetical protein